MVRTAHGQLRALGAPARAEQSSARLFREASSKTHTLRPPFTHGDKTEPSPRAASDLNRRHTRRFTRWPAGHGRPRAAPAGFLRDILALSREAGQTWAESWLLAAAVSVASHRKGEVPGARSGLQASANLPGAGAWSRCGHTPWGGEKPGLLASGPACRGLRFGWPGYRPALPPSSFGLMQALTLPG